MSESPLYRVGEVAERTGVTVRTLHHYEAEGLLAPARTEAGHRRYGPADVERLQQITSLRALGLGLGAVAAALDAPDFDPAAVVAQQRAALGAEADRLAALAGRLAGLERLLRQRAAHGTPVPSDTFLALVQTMSDLDRHYTPEQRQALSARRDALGPDALADAEAEWPRLYARLGQALDRGTDPADAEVQAVVARMDTLVGQFTGGDAGIERSLGHAWEADLDGLASMMGLTGDRLRTLFAYAAQAREAR